MIAKRFIISRICGMWKLTYLLTAFLLVSLMTLLVLWEDRRAELIKTLTDTQIKRVGTENEIEWRIDDVAENEVDFNKQTETGMDTNVNGKVVIGVVSCRNKTVDTDPVPDDTIKYVEKMEVMLKSVIISAKLHNNSTVEVHLFLEQEEDEELFVGKLAEMGYPNDEGPELLLFVHSVVDAVPENYRDGDHHRCGYVRFFYPSALPEVDAIIHLGFDMIVTGNIGDIWGEMRQFQEKQFIGVTLGIDVNETNYLNVPQDWSGDTPYPTLNGINAGLLMNLTRMREYGWEQKFLGIYEDHYKLVDLSGQQITNLLLSKDPEVARMLSCQFNFFNKHCDNGLTCTEAMEGTNENGIYKPGGIHLVHGSGKKFETGRILHDIFKGYQQFDMSILRNHENDHDGLVAAVKTHLMVPIRSAYDYGENCLKLGASQCFGTLNDILFQEFFNDSFDS